MAKHIVTLINWHDRGWDGRVCDEPERNPYCIGPQSYLDKLILGDQNSYIPYLNEQRPCHSLMDRLPCFFSINTFGHTDIQAKRSISTNSQIGKVKMFGIPSGTYYICIPITNGNEDHLKSALNQTDTESLIFYILNASNPLVESRLLVGVSTVEAIGEPIWVSDCEYPVLLYPLKTSFPSHGFLLPYYRYLNDRVHLNNLITHIDFQKVPRSISDDQAIGLFESIIPSIQYLLALDDQTMDWVAILAWAMEIVERLWRSRGLFPGKAVIEKYYCTVEPKIKDSLARFDFTSEQLGVLNYLKKLCPSLTIEKVAENPYLLSEITLKARFGLRLEWSLIDRGMFPHECLLQKWDDTTTWNRTRALVRQWIRSRHQTIAPTDECIHELSSRMKRIDELRCLSNTNFEIDQVISNEKIFVEHKSGRVKQFGLLEIEDDEKLIADRIDSLLKRQPMPLRIDLDMHIEEARTRLINLNPEQMDAIRIALTKPLLILTGTAGSGKSTVISVLTSLMQTLWPTQKCLLLTYTGKARAVLREKIRLYQSEANLDLMTIDSLLCNRRWSSKDYGYNRTGYKPLGAYSSLIIDEMSMVATETLANVFRALDIDKLQHIILVGDPMQLPPIDAGRPFVDLIDYIETESSDSYIELRQCLRVSRSDHKLAHLAQLSRSNVSQRIDHWASIHKTILQEITTPREDGDSSVMFDYWSDEMELAELLKKWIPYHLNDGKETLDSPRDSWQRLWPSASLSFRGAGSPEEREQIAQRLNKLQILTPFRIGLTGTMVLNLFLQHLLNPQKPRQRFRGFGLLDKVIMTKNKRNIRMYHFKGNQLLPLSNVTLYNGQIGLIEPNRQKLPIKKLSRIAVRFPDEDGLTLFDISYPPEDMELGYALTVHKIQGSEFDRVMIILQRESHSVLQRELFHTALTRARNCCHLLIQDGLETLGNIIDPNNSALAKKSSRLLSAMENFSTQYSNRNAIHSSTTDQ